MTAKIQLIHNLDCFIGTPPLMNILTVKIQEIKEKSRNRIQCQNLHSRLSSHPFERALPSQKEGECTLLLDVEVQSMGPTNHNHWFRKMWDPIVKGCTVLIKSLTNNLNLKCVCICICLSPSNSQICRISYYIISYLQISLYYYNFEVHNFI